MQNSFPQCLLPIIFVCSLTINGNRPFEMSQKAFRHLYFSQINDKNPSQVFAPPFSLFMQISDDQYYFFW